jgi:hypothetical protein
LLRSPVACVRESIHAEGGLLGLTSSVDEQEAAAGLGGEADCIRESVHLPPPSPPAIPPASLSPTATRGSLFSCWEVGSPRGCAAAGSEGGLGGTLSIVERIQQLDAQKKQAVAR